MQTSKVKKIAELQQKLQKYQDKLDQRRKGFGEVVRTRFGDSYEDQLRDDTNALESVIESIKSEIMSLKNE